LPASTRPVSPHDADDEFDGRMMQRALVLARKGRGLVEPNPMVGCVITRGRRVLAEGYHRRFGLPHAEIEAIRACRGRLAGATVYVSLEPCCHHGKTPPCTEALIKARVSRVVAAITDPSPAVDGRGLRRLRDAGIDVTLGLLAPQAAELIAPFATRARLGRPYVIAKWAQSLDGKLVTRAGRSKWISCPQSRRYVHRLRAGVDAILVGAGTVAADDPLLTARNVRILRRALRVVLDGRLRIAESCRLVKTAGETPTLVLTSPQHAAGRKAERLKSRGVEVVACPLRRGRLSLLSCLHVLASRDVTNLLVEGGPTVLTSFFEAGLVDEALVFVAPTFIGGGARSVLGRRGYTPLAAAPLPLSVQMVRSGDDALLRMRFEQSEPRAEAS